MKTTRRRVQCNSMDISQDPRKFKGERGRRQVGLKGTLQSGIKEKVCTVDLGRKKNDKDSPKHRPHMIRREHACSPRVSVVCSQVSPCNV